MDIKQQTKNVAAQGRYGDSMLLHVNPAEVKGLASAMPITINPETGQPEAFLPFLAPVLGSLAGSAFLPTLIPSLAGKTLLASAIGSGLAQTAATGDIKKGLLAGLTGYGIGSALQGAGAVAQGATEATQAASEAATSAAAGLTGDAATQAVTDSLTQTAAQQAATQGAAANLPYNIAPIAGVEGAVQPTMFQNLKSAFTAPGTIDPTTGAIVEGSQGFSLGSGASNLASGLMQPSAYIPAGIGMGATGIMESQEAFARQIGESEEAYRRRRLQNLLDNPEPILYSAEGGLTQFDEGGFVDNLLSGDYGMLGLLSDNPELMFGATGIAAKNNFRGSLLGELYNQYKKKKDSGDDVGAAALQSEIQNQEQMQMSSSGGPTGYFMGGDVRNMVDRAAKNLDNITGGELPQIYAPAKEAYAVNPNFMPGFAPETMYFNPATISAPASGLEAGGPPVVVDTYEGSKGGYGGRQAYIAPQVSIDPFSAYTGVAPEGLKFGKPPRPVFEGPELPNQGLVNPGIPDFNQGPIGLGARIGIPNIGDLDMQSIIDSLDRYNIPEREIAMGDYMPITGQDLGITPPRTLGEPLPKGVDNNIDISQYLGSREDNLEALQAMFGPQVEYATGPVEGSNYMMTASELEKLGVTPQPVGSGMLGKGPIMYPDLLNTPAILPEPLTEEDLQIFEPPIRDRKEGGDTLKPIPKDNKGLPNLPKDVRNEMGYMQSGGMTDMQNDPLTKEVTMFILGETDNEQALNDFITKYGSDAFMKLREAVLQSIVPNAQTEGLIRGDGEGGMDDDLRGMIGNKERIAVSQDEFIVPADVVSMLGDGSSDAGSKELYDMMDRVRKEKTGTTQQAPKLANAGGLLPA